jgi:hypothetical protein
MLVVFVLTTLVKKSKKSKESFAQVLCANEWSFVQVLKNNSRLSDEAVLSGGEEKHV